MKKFNYCTGSMNNRQTFCNHENILFRIIRFNIVEMFQNPIQIENSDLKIFYNTFRNINFHP